MTTPTFTALPTPPNRESSPETFSSDADAFLGALPQFQTDGNTIAAFCETEATTAETSASTAEAARDAAITARNAAQTAESNAATSATNAAASAAAAAASEANLGRFDDVTSSATELNILDGATVTTAELNKLDGVTATTTELNRLDGVTSNVQTQINNLSSSRIGHGQSWYAVTRSATAWYHNITGRPIQLAYRTNAGQGAVIFLNDSASTFTATVIDLGDGDSGEYDNLQLIIPEGWYYYLGSGIRDAFELR